MHNQQFLSPKSHGQIIYHNPFSITMFEIILPHRIIGSINQKSKTSEPLISKLSLMIDVHQEDRICAGGELSGQ
jgi:hypothetical protein